jgi:hypothetical protein
MLLQSCSSTIGLHLHGQPYRYVREEFPIAASSADDFLCLFMEGGGSALCLTSSLIPPLKATP